MIKLCVFDLDGTLLNTLYALTKIINLTLTELGLGTVTEDDTRYLVGNGYKIFVDRAIAHFNATNEVNIENAYKIYEKYFDEYRLYKVEPYVGIVELMKELKNRDIKVVILSNKSQEGVEANVKKCFEEGLFDAVYGERKGVRIKPAPDALELIIKEFSCKKEEVLYFGDSDVDMQTATNAKLIGVGVLWGFRDRKELEENGAKYIVDKPSKILDLL